MLTIQDLRMALPKASSFPRLGLDTLLFRGSHLKMVDKNNRQDRLGVGTPEPLVIWTLYSVAD